MNTEAYNQGFIEKCAAYEKIAGPLMPDLIRAARDKFPRLALGADVLGMAKSMRNAMRKPSQAELALRPLFQKRIDRAYEAGVRLQLAANAAEDAGDMARVHVLNKLINKLPGRRLTYEIQGAADKYGLNKSLIRSALRSSRDTAEVNSGSGRVGSNMFSNKPVSMVTGKPLKRLPRDYGKYDVESFTPPMDIARDIASNLPSNRNLPVMERLKRHWLGA